MHHKMATTAADNTANSIRAYFRDMLQVQHIVRREEPAPLLYRRYNSEHFLVIAHAMNISGTVFYESQRPQPARQLTNSTELARHLHSCIRLRISLLLHLLKHPLHDDDIEMTPP